MSYCVNCGVELDESAKKCALCDTPVYDPLINKEADKPFSNVPKIPDGIKQRFIVAIISVILLIPNVVCLFVNLFFSPSFYWFVYVLASSLLVWVVFVFPFITKKPLPYLMWGFDTLACAAYIYVFYAMFRENNLWYFKIALPITLTVSLCVLIYIIWLRKKKHHWSSKMLHIAIDVFVSAAVACLAFFLSGLRIAAEIFLIIALSELVFVAFSVYCNRSKKVRAWLSKKLTY